MWYLGLTVVLLDDRAARRSCCSAIVLLDEDRKVVRPPTLTCERGGSTHLGLEPGLRRHMTAPLQRLLSGVGCSSSGGGFVEQQAAAAGPAGTMPAHVSGGEVRLVQSDSTGAPRAATFSARRPSTGVGARTILG